MSRAFLKNETADDPVVIPARAPLPPGTPNYVTPRGLERLRQELTALETERGEVATGDADESDKTRQLAELNGRIGALNQRIASAKVVEPALHSPNEVRFGATVTLKSRKPPVQERRLTIVGVDEADASNGLIAFTAPIARALMGRRPGEPVSLRTQQGEAVFEVVAIEYSV